MDSSPPFDPADPTWLAHRYDRPRETLWFRHVPRAMHAAGPFLTDDLIGDAPEHRLDRAAAVAAARDGAVPAHFIFHSAFCASTLLTRALDIPGRDHMLAVGDKVFKRAVLEFYSEIGAR